VFAGLLLFVVGCARPAPAPVAASPPDDPTVSRWIAVLDTGSDEAVMHAGWEMREAPCPGPPVQCAELEARLHAYAANPHRNEHRRGNMATVLLAQYRRADTGERLAAAGRQGAEPNENLFFRALHQDQEYRSALTEAELLHHLVPVVEAGDPVGGWAWSAFEVELGSYLDDADREVLERHRRTVVPQLLASAGNGSAHAALLLAELDETDAIPVLFQSFLDVDRAIAGWGATDQPVFPERYLFRLAIEHLAGKPIQQAVTPSDEQEAALRARDDEAAKANLELFGRQ